MKDPAVTDLCQHAAVLDLAPAQLLHHVLGSFCYGRFNLHVAIRESWNRGGITIAGYIPRYRDMGANEKGARINRAPFSMFYSLSTPCVNV